MEPGWWQEALGLRPPGLGVWADAATTRREGEAGFGSVVRRAWERPVASGCRRDQLWAVVRRPAACRLSEGQN